MSDHPTGDDRISAWLDGELSPAARDEFAAELEQSAALRAEVDGFAAIRAAVRSLPEIEAPIGFYERLGRADTPVVSIAKARRSPARRAVAPLIAIAAAWLLILGFGAGVDALRVVPPLEAFADRHGTAYAATDGFTKMDMEDARAMGPVMAGMELKAAWHAADVVQLVYADDPSTISVFRQPGGLADDAMPAGAMPMNVAGMPAYVTEMDKREVVVVNAGDAVFTLVGDAGDHDHMVALASAVPTVRRETGLWATTRRGIDRVADFVGL